MTPAERRLMIAAFLTLFGILAAQALLETARDALFLTHLPVGQLPWLYLAMGALAMAASRASVMGVGRTRRRALPLSLLLGAGITAGLALALARGNRAAVYLLFLWSGVFAAFTVTQVWTAIAETMDLSLAKRVYGRLAAGGGVGGVAGAAAARLLSDHAAPWHMVLLAAALFVVTALGPALAVRMPEVPVPIRATSRAVRRRRARLIEHPYVTRLFLAVLLGTMVSTLLDFAFKEAVVAQLPAARLPAFFASFHLVSGAVALLIQVFGVGLLVRAAGVARAPVMHPFVLLAGLAAVAITGGLATIVLLRGLDGALRSSFHRPTFELLQAPLGERIRLRAKPLIDVAGQRAGQALAALTLVLVLRVQIAPQAHLAIAGVLLLAWAVTVWRLGHRYVDLLRSALVQPRMSPSVDPALTLDGAAQTALQAALDHPRQPEVIAALIELLRRREARGPARAALARLGDAAFSAVAAALSDPGQPLSIRGQLPRALSEIDPPRSVAVLLDGLLIEQDGLMRFRILRALSWVRRVQPATTLDEDILGRAALGAVSSAYRYLSWRHFLQEGAARRPERRTATWELLRDLLREKEENAVERLFSVLSLRYPREDFPGLLRALRLGGARTRAAGSELIENLLVGPARGLTLALIGESSDQKRLEAMSALISGGPAPTPSYRDLLEAMRLEEAGATLAALAAHHLAELQAVPAARPQQEATAVARA